MLEKLRTLIKKRLLKKKIRENQRNLRISNSAILLENTHIQINGNRKDICLEIGDESIVNCGFVFESPNGRIQIGNRCFINRGTMLISNNNIVVDDDVMMAWGIVIYDHNAHSLNIENRVKDISTTYHELEEGITLGTGKDWSVVENAPIHICSNVWIGFDAVILKGVTIGEGAVIAARAVVTHDVAPYTVVAGNPAKVVKIIQREGI